MPIEYVRLRNFKAFQDAELRRIPRLCVLVGPNGSGKSTLFNLFGFLQDAMASNVQVALARLGGNRGFEEVRSRGQSGSIGIELVGVRKPLSPHGRRAIAVPGD